MSDPPPLSDPPPADGPHRENDAAAPAEPPALLPDILGFWARLDPR